MFIINTLRIISLHISHSRFAQIGLILGPLCFLRRFPWEDATLYEIMEEGYSSFAAVALVTGYVLVINGMVDLGVTECIAVRAKTRERLILENYARMVIIGSVYITGYILITFGIVKLKDLNEDFEYFGAAIKTGIIMTLFIALCAGLYLTLETLFNGVFAAIMIVPLTYVDLGQSLYTDHSILNMYLFPRGTYIHIDYEFFLLSALYLITANAAVICLLLLTFRNIDFGAKKRLGGANE